MCNPSHLCTTKDSMQYVGCLAKECLTARCSAHYHRYDLVAELWLPRRKYLHYRFVVVAGIVGGVVVEYLLPQDKGVAFCYHPIMPIVRPREEEEEGGVAGGGGGVVCQWSSLPLSLSLPQGLLPH
jgi:hypothetical protein